MGNTGPAMDEDRTGHPPRGGGRASGRIRAEDVAVLAKVSSQTVSRVVNGADNVRPQTRARVVEAMAKLGYAPSQAARALRSGGGSATIGVVVHHLARTGEARIMEAVARTAHARGYAVTLLDASSEDAGDMNRALGHLGHDISGLIVLSLETARIERVDVPPRLPVVAADNRAFLVPAVGFDQRGGAHLAVTHLLGQGHRTVHHLAGPQTSLQARSREEEWRRTLAAADRDVPEPLHGDWTLSSGYELGRRLAADPGVTAIFAANDEMAAGLLRALHEAGRRIPRDVSVVGFDDIIGGYLWPPLTTIHQDFAAMGENLVRLLLRQLDPGTGDDAAIESLIPARLVIRSTTGPPRG